MKLGVALIAVGIGLLILSVPYAISSIVSGVFHSTRGNLPGGIPPYVGIVGGCAGIALAGIGATRIFK